ncbi:RNA polymerase sigma factor [Streptomyces qinzhouensis]|uniref:Sigma-70 family RNA polymerase sigma factor n=1 Tax=Streptomyces qinzhouensis TaxID=2599401 RepID=A0A5B8JJ76_9ACTN|nr:sigma-70 family RNA polymerase sigma factor [Streptomyces qinzhouensis]QDY77553.1 sigma-70 family RNA polymerase sigma factor [Streptomyces qinzhouensis]
MKSDDQAARWPGTKAGRQAAARMSVPRPSGSKEVIGGHGEEQLPPASRKQWKQTLGMRLHCLALAYKYVSWDEAEDVWQDTKTAMWGRLGKGPVDTLPAYVKTVCRHAAVDRLKRTKARAEVFFGDDVERLESREPVFNVSIDGRIRELLAVIRPVMTEHEARVFVLRAGLGWRVKSVAEALGISEDAVKSAYYAGKKKIAPTGTGRGAIFRLLNPE